MKKNFTSVLLFLLVTLKGFCQSAVPLPGRIEAENFTAGSGVTPSAASEENSMQIGWMSDSTWMEYAVSVAAAGYYKFEFRVANGFSDNAALQIRNTAGSVLAHTPVPRTGGMNEWKTVALLTWLPAGNQSLRLFTYKGVFSLNWFEVSQPLKPVPGRIEAEDFDLSYQVNTENTSDAGGGLNVNNIDDGEWMDYLINITETADYTLRFRVANAYGYGIIKVINLQGDTLATVNVPQTGGWQSWSSIETTASLTAGQQVLRIFAGRGAFNLNWLETDRLLAPTVITFAPLASKFVTDTPFTLSASSNNTESPLVFSSSDTTIISVAFENGSWKATPRQAGNATITASQAAGTHFQAATASQPIQILTPPVYLSLPGRIEAENFYASSGLSAGNTSDDNGNQDIGWIGDNNWLDYPVHIPVSGYYTFTFRVANGFSDEAALRVLSADHAELARLAVPRTGGMNNWKTVPLMVWLSAGNRILRIDIPKGLFSLNWFEAQQNIKAIPGRIEAESFDLASDVGTEQNSDQDNGVNIHSIDDNDWMEYNVSVAQAGSHVFNFRIANAYGNGIIEIRNSNGTVLGEVNVPQTGGWQNWSSVSTTATLPAGNQLLRFHAKRGAFNFNWADVAYGSIPQTASVIVFPAPADKEAGTAPFDLGISSNNTESPIQVASSDTTVATVHLSGGAWYATPVAAGTATLTVTQGTSTHYLAADPVSRPVTILPANSAGAQKITLDPARWYILNNAEKGLDDLFDGVTNANVNIGWGMVMEEYEAYYPLYDNETMTLEKIRMFDFEGIFADKPMTISVINDQWQRIPVATFTGESYGSWTGPYPDRNTGGEARFNLDSAVTNIRYLVLKIRSGLPTELEFYGTHTPGTPPAPVAGNAQAKLKDMLGVNAYEWNFQDGNTPWQINEDKMNMAKSFSGIRHYIDWEKLESSEGVYSFNPTLSGGWHYDQIYERCRLEGIEVLACIKTLPGWMASSYPQNIRDHENIPALYGSDISLPQSYIQQARVAFQFAARYGSNTQVDSTLLSVYSIPRWPGDNPNTIKIGTDLVKYMECDNERDKWWKGRPAYQTAREYAANLSAFYDGHKNTMGQGVGVKNADPSMKVVVAGLVSGPEYIRAMVDWCKEFRGYKTNGEVNLCWDVINYHIYTDNTSSSQSGTSDRGAAVEVTNANVKTDAFIQVAKELCYGMPVWITETGFDTHQDSPLKAIPIGNKTALETQADWILRMSLFSARHGIGKVFFYQMFDDNSTGGIFGTSGLIEASNLTRRPAADFLYQTRKLFGEYHFDETISQYPLVDRYSDNGKGMYVLVMPTESGLTGSYTLSLSGYPKARIYTPTPGQENMTMLEANVQNGQLTVSVGETPVFVVPAYEDTGVGVFEQRSAARLAEDGTDARKDFSDKLIVYPNIATTHITIGLENESAGDLQVRIFDPAAGRLYKSTALRGARIKGSRIDVTDIPEGIYVVELKQGQAIAYRKIVKSAN
ncbi:carbohydrate-binding protein [Ravibacter arvi]